MIEIKSWEDGRVLYTAAEAVDVRTALVEAVARGADLRGADLQGAYLQGAYLQGAYLRGADLQGADLRGAYLQGAYLQGAYLQGAYLQGAYLQGADLRGAYLRGADGYNPHRTDDLRILLDQPGKIRAYKLVTSDGKSPIQSTGRLTYNIGDTLEVPDANTDESLDCAAGINLATLPWCLREWREGYRVLICEFTAADISAIPHASDGKFRVSRCTVVAEKDLTKIFALDAVSEEASTS